MNKHTLAAALAFVMLPSIASPAEPLTVPDVIKRHHVLTGQTVDIIGWLSSCKGFDCILWPDEQAMRVPRLSNPPIFIGEAADELERSMAAAASHTIVLRVRVTKDCWFDDKLSCTDRADRVQPLKLVEIIRPAASKPE